MEGVLDDGEGGEGFGRGVVLVVEGGSAEGQGGDALGKGGAGGGHYFFIFWGERVYVAVRMLDRSRGGGGGGVLCVLYNCVLCVL